MEINKLIDHTLLKQDATSEQVIALCKEAKEHHFMSVCVNPAYVPLAAKELEGSDVLVCTVVGFPLGMNLTQTKLEETKLCIANGAKEIDMVINVGMLKAKEDEYVFNEIKTLKEACGDLVLKVIIESCLLTDEEIIRVSKISKMAGADFVKTSTGFSTGGATEHAVRLMREAVGPTLGVKASGGVRTREDLDKMVLAGATRIGTSNGVKIING